MATYEYKCAECGSFEYHTAIGTAPSVGTCPVCGREARRIFSPPSLVRTPPALASALQREEASRDNPAVVTKTPPRPHRPREPHPALAHLPRP
ncbi:FmdB family zinc ribbon protein [Carbonactinospora thermoautotrophica]|uniref:FmdB family zinc ribbon protein n=1 Tax=Carbonactinospora thermoautotrophica TaxID=1469144 RepID=UPI00099EDCB9